MQPSRLCTYTIHYNASGDLIAYASPGDIIYHDRVQICPDYSDATPLIEEAQKLGIPVQVPGILKFPYHCLPKGDGNLSTYVEFSSELPESNYNFCPENSRIVHPYIRHGMPRMMEFEYEGSSVCHDGYDIILDYVYGIRLSYVQDPATCTRHHLPPDWIEHYKVRCKGRPRPVYFVHPEPTNIHPVSLQDCCCRLCFDYSFTKGLPAGWVVVGDYSITEYGLLCRSAYCLVFPAEYGEEEGNGAQEPAVYENGSFTIPPAACVGAKFRGIGFLALSDDVVGGVVSGGPGTGAHFFVGELNDLINYGPARAYFASTVIDPFDDSFDIPLEQITYTYNFHHVSFCKVNPTTEFIRKTQYGENLKRFSRTISLNYLYGFAPLGYRLLSYDHYSYGNSDVPLSIKGGSTTIVANYDFDEVPLRYFYLYGGSHLTEVEYCTSVPDEENVSRAPTATVLSLKLKIPSGGQIVAGPPSSMTGRAIDITLPNIPRAHFDPFPPDSVTVPTFVHDIGFAYRYYGYGVHVQPQFAVIAFIPGATTDLLRLPVLIRNGGVNYANHRTVLMFFDSFSDSWRYQRLCDAQYRQISAPPASPVVIANLWDTSQIVTINTHYYNLHVWEESILCYELDEQTYCAAPGPVLVNSPTHRSYVNLNGQIIDPGGDIDPGGSYGTILFWAGIC